MRTIAFDLDNTIVDHLGKGVRPGMRELIERLTAFGYRLILFTSSTRQRATIILRDHELDRFFDRLVCREDYDPGNQDLVKDLRVFGADILIDDYEKHVDFAESVGRIGIRVSNYRGGRADTAELRQIGARLTGWTARVALWLSYVRGRTGAQGRR